MRTIICILALAFVLGCSSTEIIESPKTAFVSDTEAKKEPKVIWTSQTYPRGYDYLGRIVAQSWSYEGALDRLIEGGKDLRADALVDVHYQKVGFLSRMQAFAVKVR